MNTWIVLIAAILLLISYVSETILLTFIPTMKKELQWLKLTNWGYAIAFGLLMGQLMGEWF